MAKSIRQAGLKIVVAMLRLFSGASRAGWRRSGRPVSLDGR